MDINDIVATIATAVEEQSASTKDIAGNVNRQRSDGSYQVNSSAQELSKLAEQLKAMVEQCKL